MTSPTEQEIVARAIKECFDKGKTGYDHLSQAAISALHHHRAKNAGEVEKLLTELRVKFDAMYGHQQRQNHIQFFSDPGVASVIISEAANLISSMRAVIEEKE